MKLEIEGSRLWGLTFDNGSYQEAVGFEFYICFCLPRPTSYAYLYTDHINWVKRAWGLMPEVKPLKAEPDDWPEDLMPF